MTEITYIYDLIKSVQRLLVCLLVAMFLDILGSLGNARVGHRLLYASAREGLGRDAVYGHRFFLGRPVCGHPGQGGGDEDGLEGDWEGESVRQTPRAHFKAARQLPTSDQ